MLKKFLLEGSGTTVPENAHPLLKPLTMPVGVTDTTAGEFPKRFPFQVPVMSDIDAGVL
jgi:hypothetical protein